MSFVVTIGHAQADGRRYVREVYSDGQGEFARLEYLAANGADYEAIATAIELVLRESAAAQEIVDAVDRDAMPSLRFQTGAQALARFRSAFRNAQREEVCRLARWILARNSAGQITDAQMQSAFNMNAAELALFKLRLATIRDALNSVEGARGE